MTTTETTETTEIEQPTACRQLAGATLAEQVAAQKLTLTEVTQEFVYELPSPIRLQHGGIDKRMERIRVQATRRPNPTTVVYSRWRSERTQRPGGTVVAGYLRTVNQNGSPRDNGVAGWVSLAELSTLTVELIHRALTEA